MYKWMAAFLGVGVLLLAGCGGGGQLGVSGAVSLKGKPLDQGTITFLPATPGQGSMSGTTIKDGKYKVPAGQGLVPGEYLVQISSGEGGAASTAEAPGAAGPLAKERIPSDYNSQTKQRVTVAAGKQNVFDFSIP